MFNEHFPLSEYEYKDFLQAAACFPHFCSESNSGRAGQIGSLTPYSICKKELATFFAHRIYDTGAGTNGLNSYNSVELYGITDISRQGLMFIEDENCISGIRGESCRAYTLDDPVGYSGAFPRPDQTSYYYTRGLGKLHGNKDYGMFSEFMFGDKSVLLEDPDRVVNEPWLAFASSIWRWMTPVSPTPSNHELVTGQWVPNAVELSAGLNQGLGVTIVASFGSLCGPGQDNGSAFDIYQYYKKFLTLFNLVEFATDTNVCEKMTKTFPATGSAVRTLFWKWSGSECVLQSTTKTPWLLTIPGDFKRCWADNAGGWAYLPKFNCYYPDAALYFPGDCIGVGNDYVIIPTLDDSQISSLTGYRDSFDGNDWWLSEGPV